MPDDSARSPRRRPVDALFGEQVELNPKSAEIDSSKAKQKATTPGYQVEPPRPAPILRPPPPEFPNDWRAIAPSEPISAAAVLEESLVAEPVPAPPAVALPRIPAAIQDGETRPAAATLTAPSPEAILTAPPASEAPILVTPPMMAPPTKAAPAPAPRPVEPPPYRVESTAAQDLLALSQFIDQLYQNVADETSDNAALNAECQSKLHGARVAIEKGDYAQAEFLAEQVKARLLRARTSADAVVASSTRLIVGWLVVAGLVGLIVFLLPFVFVRLVPLIAQLLRAVALGVLGASIASLWNLSRAIRQRDYDPQSAMSYALAPGRGLLVGVVMLLLSVSGILAAPGALGTTIEPYLLMYLFALVGGINSDAIFDALRGIVAGVIRGRGSAGG